MALLRLRVGDDKERGGEARRSIFAVGAGLVVFVLLLRVDGW